MQGRTQQAAGRLDYFAAPSIALATKNEVGLAGLRVREASRPTFPDRSERDTPCLVPSTGAHNVHFKARRWGVLVAKAVGPFNHRHILGKHARQVKADQIFWAAQPVEVQMVDRGSSIARGVIDVIEQKCGGGHNHAGVARVLAHKTAREARLASRYVAKQQHSVSSARVLRDGCAESLHRGLSRHVSNHGIICDG